MIDFVWSHQMLLNDVDKLKRSFERNCSAILDPEAEYVWFVRNQMQYVNGFLLVGEGS